MDGNPTFVQYPLRWVEIVSIDFFCNAGMLKEIIALLRLWNIKQGKNILFLQIGQAADLIHGKAVPKPLYNGIVLFQFII